MIKALLATLATDKVVVTALVTMFFTLNTCHLDMQREMRPILLRRMKEDVEQLPEKEEVIVWVELTRQQQFYYKALYSQQVCCTLVLQTASWCQELTFGETCSSYLRLPVSLMWSTKVRVRQDYCSELGLMWPPQS